MYRPILRFIGNDPSYLSRPAASIYHPFESDYFSLLRHEIAVKCAALIFFTRCFKSALALPYTSKLIKALDSLNLAAKGL